MGTPSIRVTKIEFEGPYDVAIAFEQGGSAKIIRASGTSAQEIRTVAEAVLQHLLETERTLGERSGK